MANLGDYDLVSNDDMVVDALKEGLRNAQRMLRTLKMGMSPHAKNKKWFMHPWEMENVYAKHLAYQPSKNPTPCKDGDFEVLREQIQDAIGGYSHPIVEHVEFVVVHSGLDIMNIMEMETQDDEQFLGSSCCSIS